MTARLRRWTSHPHHSRVLLALKISPGAAVTAAAPNTLILLRPEHPLVGGTLYGTACPSASRRADVISRRSIAFSSARSPLPHPIEVRTRSHPRSGLQPGELAQCHRGDGPGDSGYLQSPQCAFPVFYVGSFSRLSFAHHPCAARRLVSPAQAGLVRPRVPVSLPIMRLVRAPPSGKALT